MASAEPQLQLYTRPAIGPRRRRFEAFTTVDKIIPLQIRGAFTDGGGAIVFRRRLRRG